MSRGRKPKGNNSDDIENVFYNSQGIYFQYIINNLFQNEPNSNNKKNSSLLLKQITDARVEHNSNKVKQISPLKPITQENEPFNIPSNWLWFKLGDVIEFTENLNIETELASDTIINYVDIDAIDNKKFKIRETKPTPVSRLSSRARRVLKKDFILYSLVRPYLNNIAIVEEELDNMIGSTGFAVFSGIYINNEYIKLWLLSDFVRNYYLNMLSGFNSPSISADQFFSTPIPVAPLDEQISIVNFIKSLIEKKISSDYKFIPKSIQEGILSLQKLQTNAIKYTTISFNQKQLLSILKQSILKEVTQGNLTLDWRQKNKNIVSSSELLESLRELKRKLIKEEKIKNEKPLPPIKTEDTPFALPYGWVWAVLDELVLFTNGKAHEQLVDPNGKYILVNSKFVSNSGTIKKYASELLTPLHMNDIAIVMSDVPDGRALSRCFLIDKNDTYTLNQRIGSLTPLVGVNPEYLNIVLDRNEHFLKFNDSKKQTNLKKEQILSCPIPLPNTHEQTEIVNKVKLLMQKCQSLEFEINHSEEYANQLMKAVLKEAFETKTEVCQD